MIKVKTIGDLKPTMKFLRQCQKPIKDRILHKYGKIGVNALKNSTPKQSGNTANQWSYSIEKSNDMVSLTFKNSNINKGVPIAIILQYGHGTKNGGYVRGIDYINPALEPVFERLSRELWGEVIK